MFVSGSGLAVSVFVAMLAMGDPPPPQWQGESAVAEDGWDRWEAAMTLRSHTQALQTYEADMKRWRVRDRGLRRGLLAYGVTASASVSLAFLGAGLLITAPLECNETGDSCTNGGTQDNVGTILALSGTVIGTIALSGLLIRGVRLAIHRHREPRAPRLALRWGPG